MPKKFEKKVEEPKEIKIEITRGYTDLYLLGRTPLICNRVSEKAKRILLLPPLPMNKAERQINIKHNPWEEYRESPYKNLHDGPTRIQGLGAWFKESAVSAVRDEPGMTMAEVGRMLHVDAERIDIYGVPQIFMAIVRNSGFPPTPDIRTRAILPRWACHVRMIYSMPRLSERGVVKLSAAAGIVSGVGDFRPEKRKGIYGQYELVPKDHPEFQAILKEGREAQDEALANPVAYDDETASMLTWFDAELDRRSKQIPNKKKKGEEDEESAAA